MAIADTVLAVLQSKLRGRRPLELFLQLAAAVLCVGCYFFVSQLIARISRKHYSLELWGAGSGFGCDVPVFSPFSHDMLRFHRAPDIVTCPEEHNYTDISWVTCRFSVCQVELEILERLQNVECEYRELLFVDKLTHPTVRYNAEPYNLTLSDHVHVECIADTEDGEETSWTGWATGLRPIKKPATRSRKRNPNLLLIMFDSAARNTFIRKMPQSFIYLKKEFNATIFEKYHIVGDGTRAALTALLTGKLQSQVTDVRANITSNYADSIPFIFYPLKESGYRTAYLEDMPWHGTYQAGCNGFIRQPTDHYLWPLLNAVYRETEKRSRCFGSIPNYQLLLNLTEQLTMVEGKKFTLCFTADISRDSASAHLLTNADRPLVALLRRLVARGVHDDTLVVVMGDHGPKYGSILDTYHGEMEERLPFLAVRAPERWQREALAHNVDALVTPFDLHATLLDAAGLPDLIDDYREKNSHFPRQMSLFTPIPRNRTCGDAGISQHWCVCVGWELIPNTDALHIRLSIAFIDRVNVLTYPLRHLCAIRYLISIEWVKRAPKAKNTSKSSKTGSADIQHYHIKVKTGPGEGIFEASLAYQPEGDQIFIHDEYISRISAYGVEAQCLTYSVHIRKFCYCLHLK